MSDNEQPRPLELPTARAAKREFVCAGCGYGSIRPQPPGRCPMCGGSDWHTPPPLAA